MAHQPLDEALSTLQVHLRGSAYTKIDLGDWWALSFDNGNWLLAQHLASPLEPEIRRALETVDTDTALLGGVDAEDIPAAVAVLRSRRQAVTDVLLGVDGSLVLRFADGGEIKCCTDTEVVDWQWALNETGTDPYLDFAVACFWKGEVVVG